MSDPVLSFDEEQQRWRVDWRGGSNWRQSHQEAAALFEAYRADEAFSKAFWVAIKSKHPELWEDER